MAEEVKVRIAGDDSSLAASLKRSTTSIGSFVASAKSFLSGLAATAAATALGAFFKSAVDEAAKAELGMARLGQAVTNAGGDFNVLSPALEQTVKSVMRLSTATDDDLRAALTNMIAISRDVEGSQKNLALATDLAAFKNISLEEAATMVGKAMAGNVTAFNKMGVAGKDATTVLENARASFGGFAEQEANTFQGSLIRLTNQWGEFKEAVGTAILSSGEMGGATNALIDRLVSLEQWVTDNQTSISALVGDLLDLTDALGTTGAAFASIPLVGDLVIFALGAVTRALQGVAGTLKFVEAAVEGFAGAVLVALGTMTQVGGMLLKLFGVSVVEETGRSMAEAGRKLLASADQAAQEGLTLWDKSANRLKASTQAVNLTIEKDYTAHGATIIAETAAQAAAREKAEEAAGKARVAAAKKATAEEKKVHEDHAKWRTDNAKKMHTALTTAEANFNKALKKLADENATYTEQLRGDLEKAIGPALEGMARASTEAIRKLVAQLKERLPVKEWEKLNQQAQLYITRLEDMLPPAEDLADAAEEARKANAGMAKEVEKSSQSIAETARGALGLASAFGLVSDETAQVLNNVVNIAAALPKALKGDIGSIVQVLGSLASIIAVVGSSETEKRRQAAFAANTAALEKLTREVGNLNLRQDGKTFAGIETAVQAAIDARADARASGKGPGDSDKAAFDAFLASLKDSGIGLGEARELFKEIMGRDLAMANKGTFFQDILAFDKGLEETEFGQVAQTFEGQLGFARDRLQVQGKEDDPFAKIESIADVFAKFSPLLAGVIGDQSKLNTKEGRATAITSLQELFDQLNTGELKDRAAEVGISGSQFAGGIMELIALLRGAGDAEGNLSKVTDPVASVSAGDEAVVDATDAQTDVMSGIQDTALSSLAIEEQSLASLRSIEASLTGGVVGLEESAAVGEAVGQAVMEGLADGFAPSLLADLAGALEGTNPAPLAADVPVGLLADAAGLLGGLIPSEAIPDAELDAARAARATVNETTNTVTIGDSAFTVTTHVYPAPGVDGAALSREQIEAISDGLARLEQERLRLAGAALVNSGL